MKLWLPSTDDYVFIGDMKTGIFRYPAAMVEEFGRPVRSWRMLPPYGGVLIHPEDKKDSWRVLRILPTAEWSTIILNTGPETFSENGAGCGAAAGWCGIMRGNRNIFAGFITNMGKKT